jgi:hypothetical protein
MLGICHARTFAVKHLVAAAVLALLLPLAAHADEITFTNHDGMAGTPSVGVTGPFTLSGSEMTATLGGNPITGSVNFTTGSTFTGSLATGGSWNANGSVFDIKETGLSGYLFQGAFTAGTSIAWLAEGCGQAGNTVSCNYALNGSITGQYMGKTVNGATVQLFLTTSCTVGANCSLSDPPTYAGGFGHTYLKDTGGTTDLIVATPEPGTLGLMGTGLLGIAFAVRRKMKGQE